MIVHVVVEFSVPWGQLCFPREPPESRALTKGDNVVDPVSSKLTRIAIGNPTKGS